MSSNDNENSFISTECVPGFSVGAALAPDLGIAGFTYDLSLNELNYEHSLNSCASRENSALASILSEEEFDFASEFIRSVSTVDQVWIGLRANTSGSSDLLNPTARFSWVDGSNLSFGINDSQKPWDKDEPNNGGGGNNQEDCVM